MTDRGVGSAPPDGRAASPRPRSGCSTAVRGGRVVRGAVELGDGDEYGFVLGDARATSDPIRDRAVSLAACTT